MFGQLLPVIRRINERGAAVLVVEQSVNVALAVAGRAYCMEKGEIVQCPECGVELEVDARDVAQLATDHLGDPTSNARIDLVEDVQARGTQP